ncbi:diacylglycerol kinase [Rhodosalinus halophilus]|uniref:Diacylglycerol kinase n=1 Tax=Rhodosalinus halophilus TaxID=2259333 RepID=A0A365U8L4_9RHOB|nr:cytochrome c [Rhodosalinus halophilus]RBI85080.1 diacylglycerol kinase [Rhodosalinus halophilus]
MRRFFLVIVALAAVLAAAGWFLSAPARLPADATAGLEGDPGRGERIFLAGGCASCHAPEDAEGEERRVLAGGHRLDSEFGTFVAPNISPDPEHGIGGWTLAQFADAMMRGVSPDGRHYYPAFPYTSYAKMEMQDVADLWAFLQTLPAADVESAAHDVSFPYNLRRGIGIWKRLYVDDAFVMTHAGTAQLERGRYLVEALAHCAECHTPRDRFGGLDPERWMEGAPNPSGEGRIPAITHDALGWSASDIAWYLESGFTPDYDSAGGSMADVITNLAQLEAADREAIAAYLLALN